MRIFMIIALMVGSASGVAGAASVHIEGSAGSGPIDTLGGVLPSPDPLFFDQTAAEGPLSDSVTVPFAGCCGTTFARAKAQAAFGVLRASAEVLINGLNGPPYPGSFVAASAASVKFADSLTFTGGSGNGTATAQVVLSGGLNATGQTGSQFTEQNAGANYQLDIKSNCAPLGVCVHKFGSTSGGDIPGEYTFELNFLFGQPVALSVELFTQAFADGGVSLEGLASSATADFSNTFVWGGLLEVRDFRGVVTDFGVVSESGFDYAHAAVPSTVPVPPSLQLMLPGLFTVLASQRRRLKLDA